MADSVDVGLGADMLSVDISNRVRQVLVVHRPGSHSVRFVSEADLCTWGIPVEEAWTAAHESLKRIAADTHVELLTRGDLVLGMLHASEFHKASVIFSPSFRAQVVQRHPPSRIKATPRFAHPEARVRGQWRAVPRVASRSLSR